LSLKQLTKIFLCAKTLTKSPVSDTNELVFSIGYVIGRMPNSKQPKIHLPKIKKQKPKKQSTERTNMKTPTFLMKRLQTMVAVLGLAACGTGLANANILSNPDLDVTAVGPQLNASPVGWQIIATKQVEGSFSDGADSETFCNVQQPGGDGLFFKPFQGSTNVILDLLNVYFYQDNPSAGGAKCTLSGYASCEPNFCGLVNDPYTPNQAQTLFVVEFLDNGGNVLASNVFDLIANGMPTTGPGSMAQLTTPQYTAPAGTVTVRAGAYMLNAFGTTGAQNFFVDAFDLEQIAPAGLPVITNQPANTTALLGGSATFTVGVSNSIGASYQWQYEGNDLVNGGGISGATSQTLVINPAGTNNVGHYRVKVTNGTGTAVSSAALLALDTFNFYPVVALYGNIGSTYVLSSSPTVNGTYTPISTNTLTTSPQYLIDPTAAGNNKNFYQATFSH
jgi:Immunoglobulin domain